MGDPGQFVVGSLGAAPHRWHDASGFDDLLSLADVDAQLSGGGLRRPSVRLARDGDILASSSFTRRVRTGSVWIDDLIDPGRTLAQFADGATIVLQSLQRWWPPLAGFCRQLEDELGHPVQANAYLTPDGAAGFAPHHDTHDVFVLQVHGTKHWTVRAPLVEAPTERHRSDHGAAADQPVLFDVDLIPGDCLYLPRGFIHSAAAQDGATLHVTIGVLSVTRHDLLRRLLDRAADEPTLRAALPVGYASDPEAAGRVVTEAIADLVSWLEDVDVTQFAEDLVDREALRRRPPVEGQLLELTTLDAIDDTTEVAVRAGLGWRLGPAPADTDRVVLRLADRRVDLPAAVTPALTLLLDGEPHAVRELDHLLDRSGRSVLVRRLVREGVLRRTGPATPAPHHHPESDSHGP